MKRVSYNLLKQWVSESDFAQKYGMTVSAFNGFYHILDAKHNLVCSAETPGKCWESFSLMKRGYYMAKDENK